MPVETAAYDDSWDSGPSPSSSDSSPLVDSPCTLGILSLYPSLQCDPTVCLPPCARPLRPVRIHTTNAQPCNTRRSLNIRLHVAVLLRRVRAPPPLTVPLRCTLCFNYCHTNKLRHCLSSTISTSISPVQLHTPLRRAQRRQRQSIVFRSARRRRRPRQQHAIFSNEE